MKTGTLQILDQMFSRAKEKMLLENWSQYEISVFMNDPVIRLLYGACAEEIGRVHESIGEVEGRLIKRAIEYFLPDQFHQPFPAHAIFRAQPIDRLAECEINPEYQLMILKQEAMKRDFMFVPAGTFTVTKAEAEYLCFGNRLHQLKGDKKILIASGIQASSHQADTLWIGIKDLYQVLPKDHISLYFNLPIPGNEQFSFLNALKFCKCSSGKHVFRHNTGLNNDDTDIRDKMLTKPDYIIYQIFENVKNWYQRHFLTLNDLLQLPSEAASLPREFSTLFSETELGKIKGDITWIKLTFANLLKEEWIENLYVSINCFPAANLRIEQEQFDVESMPINIYPISCINTILALKQIVGKIRNRPEEIEYQLIQDGARETVGREGEAIFRKGGVRRLEPEKLKSLLNHLSSLLKEETILLTKDGTKEDLDKLNRLGRALLDFEKTINAEQKNLRLFSGSVVIKPYVDQTKVFVRYWSTAGEVANHIRPLIGEDRTRQCGIAYGPDLKVDSIQLITTTSGGKKRPSDVEHLNTLRKHLLTRGRVVTAEDIKAFCYDHFTPLKIIVDVAKSYLPSQIPGQGLIKCIKVTIQIDDKGSVQPEELIFLLEDLKQKLEQNSSTALPFRIDIKTL